MADSRFHVSAGPFTLAELLTRAGASDLAVGLGPSAERQVSGASELETAGPDDMVLAIAPEYAEALRASRAGIVIAGPKLAQAAPEGAAVVQSDHAHPLFARLATILYPPSIQPNLGMAAGPEPMLEAGVVLGPNVVVGPGAEIGAGTVIGPNTVIGPGVAIGRNCRIGANCAIEYTYMGNDVVLLPGVALGTSGFGFLPSPEGIISIPQLGRTIIQDRVEIGGNSVIDRGALGDTVIGEGTKIGNVVVVGHNCRIGRNCMLIGMIGMAGSITIEDNVTIAGGVGIAGHLTLGEGTIVYAKAAVSKSFPPNSKIIGAPAQDLKAFWKEMAALRRLARGNGSEREQ